TISSTPSNTLHNATLTLHDALPISPAATKAEEPPEEPPGVWLIFQGLRVGPHALGSVIALIANSGVLVRPKITKPPSRQRFTNSESSSATRPKRFKPLVPI